MNTRDLHEWSPPLAVTGWIHLGLLAGALIALPLDDRLILGISPWIKPIKFDTSILLYTWTMAWYLGRLPPSAAVRRIGWTISVTMILESLLLNMQSVRGTTSHFNNTSGFDAAVFSVMGIAIIVNTVAVVRALILYYRQQPDLDPAMLLAARLGLILFLVGTTEGGVMVAHNAHTVGGPDGGPGLPFLTWSTKFGDLRWAHFIGMHGLQALPLTAWLIGRKPVITAVFAAGLGITILALIVALQGRPMIAL